MVGGSEREERERERRRRRERGEREVSRKVGREREEGG